MLPQHVYAMLEFQIAFQHIIYLTNYGSHKIIFINRISTEKMFQGFRF